MPDPKLIDFLRVFFPKPEEPIFLRALKPSTAPSAKANRPVKLIVTWAELAKNFALQERLQRLNVNRGLYFVVNSGGDVDKSITRFNAFFVEIDDRGIDEQHVLYDKAPIQPSIRVETKKSVHCYWLIDGDCNAETWAEIQQRLIAYFNSDAKIINPSRLMRLPYFDHISTDENGSPVRKRVELIIFNPDQRYTVDLILKSFPKLAINQLHTQPRFKSDRTYSTWEELNAEVRQRILDHPTCIIDTRREWAHCRGACHNGNGSSAIALNIRTNAYHCQRGCSTAEIRLAFGLPEQPNSYIGTDKKPRFDKAVFLDKESLENHDAPNWPAPLKVEAFHGLVGDAVRLIEPHTEADPAALVIQFLVTFGNVIGRSAHFAVEGDKHYMNLFTVLVGVSSKGRKGTSWGRILQLFELAALDWIPRVQSGLSSGEGLIWAVRDAVEKQQPIKEKKQIARYEKVIIDEGVEDKRLLAFEAEFASTLRVLGREGNTLSALIRQAWDRGDLRVLTRNSPARATNAHISIIAHVTRDELRRYLDTTEAGNGFANRFLWLCIKRSKLLPEGGRLYEVDFAPVIRDLKQAIADAKDAGAIIRDEGARTLWCEIYDELSESKPGLLGAVTSRSEAQVMRLACIYALLDRDRKVRVQHLRAALALWSYCEGSARFIFGDRLGDPVADEIMRSLRGTLDGLTRTELLNLFGRHKSSSEINRALTSLSEQGLVCCQMDRTEGRTAERWLAISRAAKEAKEAKEVHEVDNAGDSSFASFASFAEPNSKNDKGVDQGKASKDFSNSGQCPN
jgi:hypothetical protein